MARRKVTVRDIGEILEHWQAGRSVRAIARSLGASRPTICKYVAIAQAHGYSPGGPPPHEGWRAFLEEAAPRVVYTDPRPGVLAELRDRHEAIRERLTHTNVMTAWLRLREEAGIKASYSSFRRYIMQYLPEAVERPVITVRREDPPPGEEAQIDFGYLGLWEDPLAGRRVRLWVFAMVLSHSRHMFACAVPRMDQAAWLESHVAAFEFWEGAPARLVTDNLKDGVIKPDLYDPRFNRGYEAVLVELWGGFFRTQRTLGERHGRLTLRDSPGWSVQRVRASCHPPPTYTSESGAQRVVTRVTPLTRAGPGLKGYRSP